MTHILIPRTPSMNLLRPFIECPTSELDQAWAAMVRIAEVQHARAGSQCLQQIEEPAGAAPAAVAPQGDKDDSLLLCASDLQHSAIYDSHSEMQDCARSVADRIKALAAPALEAPAAKAIAQAITNNFRDAGWSMPSIDSARVLEAVQSALGSAAAPQAPAAPAENMVRYCPGCGSVGTVESKYRDCCPDGGQARFIPQALAEKCRDTFKLAVDGLVSPQAAPAAPWKDHQTARLVNDLRDCAIKYHGAGQLRERIAHIVVPLCDQLKGALAAPAAPAVDAWLQPDDMAALQRFHETAEDDESYDIGKEAVARLRAFGCLQSHSFGRYSTTDFGDYLLDTWAGARTLPFTTAAERAAQAAAKGA